MTVDDTQSSAASSSVPTPDPAPPVNVDSRALAGGTHAGADEIDASHPDRRERLATGSIAPASVRIDPSSPRDPVLEVEVVTDPADERSLVAWDPALVPGATDVLRADADADSDSDSDSGANAGSDSGANAGSDSGANAGSDSGADSDSGSGSDSGSDSDSADAAGERPSSARFALAAEHRRKRTRR